MTAKLLEQNYSVGEQRLIFPGRYNWQQFKAIQALIAEVPGMRILYLDGWVEIMTLGETHETIKTIIGFLVEFYFLEKQIEFIPVGSATRESEAKETSFEPDESYYLGEKKEHPDLAIEVIITSGSINKLEKYKRFQIAEVWFWQNNQLAVYRRQNGEQYEQVSKSELLPDLDLAMLARCVLMPSKLEAMTEFRKNIIF